MLDAAAFWLQPGARTFDTFSYFLTSALLLGHAVCGYFLSGIECYISGVYKKKIGLDMFGGFFSGTWCRKYSY